MTNRSRILVTPRSLSAGHAVLDAITDSGYEPVTPAPGKTPSENDIVGNIHDCVGYLAGVEPITDRVLSSAPGLKVISRNGVGIDNIDLDAAERLGIQIRTAGGANAQGVAELTLGLLFAGLRELVQADRTLKRHEWWRAKGREISGMTLGVVGLGRIGAIVAGMTSRLGMNVLGYDPAVEPEAVREFGCESEGFGDLLRASDVITFHCPMPSDGTSVLGASELGQCRDGVFLINTARAGLIDAQAVRESLDSGHVSLYAADVFAEEPPSDWTLVDHPRVVATPHIGGYTHESVDRAARMALDNLREVIETEKPET